MRRHLPIVVCLLAFVGCGSAADEDGAAPSVVANAPVLSSYGPGTSAGATSADFIVDDAGRAQTRCHFPAPAGASPIVADPQLPPALLARVRSVADGRAIALVSSYADDGSISLAATRNGARWDPEAGRAVLDEAIAYVRQSCVRSKTPVLSAPELLVVDGMTDYTLMRSGLVQIMCPASPSGERLRAQGVVGQDSLDEAVARFSPSTSIMRGGGRISSTRGGRAMRLDEPTLLSLASVDSVVVASCEAARHSRSS